MYIDELKGQEVNDMNTVKELHNEKIELIPEEAGIYYFLLPNGFQIEVLEETEGLVRYRKWDKKKKDYVMKESRYDTKDLIKRVIQYQTNSDNNVIYIGSAVNLRERIRAFIDFRFDDIQNFHYHSGGRSVWQIKNNIDLLVAWKTVEVPEGSIAKDYVRMIERQEIDNHIEKYGCKPFANRRR